MFLFSVGKSKIELWFAVYIALRDDWIPSMVVKAQSDENSYELGYKNNYTLH